MITYLPLTPAWRSRHRAELYGWLQQNGIEPDTVPDDAGIRIENDMIHYDAKRGSPLPRFSVERRTIFRDTVVRSTLLMYPWVGPQDGDV